VRTQRIVHALGLFHLALVKSVQVLHKHLQALVLQLCVVASLAQRRMVRPEPEIKSMSTSRLAYQRVHDDAGVVLGSVVAVGHLFEQVHHVDRNICNGVR